ncbi:MAG: TenA family protein [Alphaproteobacteria bacterium]|nr:TenA family protein [Alphaproteobacteria bacterium]
MGAETSLFARLRSACPDEWQAFIGHPFVRRLGDGSLPEECFRHYLLQDYLFLIHFARAYGLAVYKSDTLEDMRYSAAGMASILDEMGLHLKYCHDWGILEEELAALPEADATIAYTRFVLDRGMAGDLLDLQVALAPCVIGYAEIANLLKIDPASRLEGNPYLSWIEMYSGDEYQRVARAQVAQLDRLMGLRGGEGRMPSLIDTFRQATRLEAGFWQMGLDVTR